MILAGVSTVEKAVFIGAGALGIYFVFKALQMSNGKESFSTSLGKAIGSSVASLTTGAIEGVASGTVEAFKETGKGIHDVANSTIAQVTGNKSEDFSIGARLFEFFNPSIVKAENDAIFGKSPSVNSSSGGVFRGAGASGGW